MGTTPQDYASRSRLLEQTKEQYNPGPMRPRLYETIPAKQEKPQSPKFEWMYYAGMGNVDLSPVNDAETKAIQGLLEEGRLVRTFSESFFGAQTIRRIQHFDDVKFGIDEQDNILIYDFVHRIDLPDMPDPVIRPDALHDAAIEQIKKRMDFSVPSHAVTIDSGPIQLKGGPVIRPIITDARLIELRKRQQEFTP